MNGDPPCGQCGIDDGDNFMWCCGIYMCDHCAEQHHEKWHSEETS